MSNLILSGFEFGAPPSATTDQVEGEGLFLQGTAPTIETTIVRHGTRSWKIPAASAATIAPSWGGLVAAGMTTNRWYYQRFPLYVAAGTITGVNSDLWSIRNGGGTLLAQLILNTTGTVQLYDSAFGNSITSSVLSRGAWNVIEIGYRIASSGVSQYELRVNGVSQGTNATAALGNTGVDQVRLGHTGAVAHGVDVYFDHLVVNDDQGSANNTWPGQGGVVFLRSSVDKVSRFGCSAGAGATTSLFDAVNNTPPTGVVNASGTNASQIHDSSASAGDNYDATMQDYITAGVPAGAIINCVQSIANVGATAAVAGSLQITSNPAEGSESSIAAMLGAGAAGTFPANWITKRGPKVDAPTPTLSTAPVLRLGKRTATANVAIADLLGIYVLFTPVTSRTAADTVTVGDAATRSALAPARTAAETETVSDAATRTAIAPSRTAAETVGVSDQAVRVAVYARTATGIVTVSDSVVTSLAMARTAAETVGVSDAATRAAYARARTAGETVVVSDAATRQVNKPRTAAETVAVSDAADRATMAKQRTAAETVSVSDAASRTSTKARTATETVGVTDAAARAAQAFARTAGDTVNVADQADTGTGGAHRTAAETVTVSDAADRLAQHEDRFAAEVVNVSDAASRTAGAQSRTATGSVSVSDSATKVLAVQRTATETVAVSDAATRVGGRNRTAGETVTIADAASRSTMTSSRTASENLTVADATVQYVSASRTAQETVTVLDAAVANQGGTVIPGPGTYGHTDGARYGHMNRDTAGHIDREQIGNP